MPQISTIMGSLKHIVNKSSTKTSPLMHSHKSAKYRHWVSSKLFIGFFSTRNNVDFCIHPFVEDQICDVFSGNGWHFHRRCGPFDRRQVVQVWVENKTEIPRNGLFSIITILLWSRRDQVALKRGQEWSISKKMTLSSYLPF